jgi:hypothetical protein
MSLSTSRTTLAALSATLLCLLPSVVQAITLQIPTRQTQFPLVAKAFEDVGSVVACGTSYIQTNIPPSLTNVVQVSAGEYHAIALKVDGTVVAWGDNNYGQTNIPAGLANVIQVAAGLHHSIALKADGTVTAWGDNTSDQATVPIGLNNVIQVAAGGYHSVALKADGTVTAWGASYLGQTIIPMGLTNVVQIAAGFYHNVALKADGAVIGWGYNINGQTNIPAGLSNVVQVAAGGYHNIALKADGTVLYWGDNIFGESNAFDNVSNVVQVSAGSYNIAALKSDGTVSSLGYDFYPPYRLTNVFQITSGTPLGVALIERMSQTIAPIAHITDQHYGMPLAIFPPISSSALPVSLSIKSGPATISGNTITPFGLGTVVVSANQSGDQKFLPAPEVTTSFAVNKGNQFIYSFVEVPAQLIGRAFSISIPDSSTGLPVTVSIKSGPAMISGNTITPIGVGTVVLAANQAGDSNWNPAREVTTSFVVRSKGQLIAPIPAISDKFYTTAPFAVAVPASSSKLPVSLTVQSGPATISGNKVTLTGTGEVVIAANQSGNETYVAAPEVTTSFTVYPANQTIALPKTWKLPTQAGSYTLPTISSSGGLPVSFSVQSGPAYITGDQLIITGPGLIQISADQGGDANHNAANGVAFSFRTGKSSQTILSDVIHPPTVPGTYVMPEIFSSGGLPVEIYLLSGPVIDAGYPNYTITRPGKVTILLRQTGDDNFKPAPDRTVTFVVKQYDQSLYPFRSVFDQTYGVAPFVVAAPLSSSGLPVTLSVKSGPAAFVKGKLVVTGAGTVTLAANQPGNVSYNAAPEATTSFTVFKADQSINPFPRISDVSFAKTKVLTINAPPATSKLPVALSVVTGPATIRGNKLTITGKGNICIAADQPGNANYNSALTVSQTFTVN